MFVMSSVMYSVCICMQGSHNLPESRVLNCLQEEEIKGEKRMQAHHGRSSKPSPLCDVNTLNLNQIDHVHQQKVRLERSPFD